MAKRFPCKPVDMTFFESAPHRYVAEVLIRVPAKTVFASLEVAEDWPRWAPPIRHVEWTSERPFGVGTTRTVYMLGGMTGYEEFIAWEAGREMAFCFTHCSRNNVESFAERYQIEEVGAGQCRVRWTMAMRPKGMGRYFLPVFSPLMRFGVQTMLGRFKRLLENRAS